MVAVRERLKVVLHGRQRRGVEQRESPFLAGAQQQPGRQPDRRARAQVDVRAVERGVVRRAGEQRPAPAPARSGPRTRRPAARGRCRSERRSDCRRRPGPRPPARSRRAPSARGWCKTRPPARGPPRASRSPSRGTAGRARSRGRSPGSRTPRRRRRPPATARDGSAGIRRRSAPRPPAPRLAPAGARRPESAVRSSACKTYWWSSALRATAYRRCVAGSTTGVAVMPTRCDGVSSQIAGRTRPVGSSCRAASGGVAGSALFVVHIEGVDPVRLGRDQQQVAPPVARGGDVLDEQRLRHDAAVDLANVEAPEGLRAQELRPQPRLGVGHARAGRVAVLREHVGAAPAITPPRTQRPRKRTESGARRSGACVRRSTIHTSGR